MKRQRGRGPQRPGNQNPNRAYDSNGPDMRVRGSAQTVFERYNQAGRDAMSSGDRVLAENCFQHAEHYLRIIKSIQPNFIPRSEMAMAGFPNENEDGTEANLSKDTDIEAVEDGAPRENRNWNQNDNGQNNNRNNRNRDRNNNRNRDRYRPDRNNDNSPESSGGENAEIALQTETVSESTSENIAPTREARPPRERNPRERRPRENNRNKSEDSNLESGFGDELPAFLSTPTPAVEAD